MAPFDDLSDYDFELLVADLLGADLGYRFETFPRGRDGGIDLRADMGNGVHIVQCKHYARSGLSALKTAAKSEKKALAGRRRSSRRYTFVSSLRLTLANKTELVDLLRPYVGSESDILGEDDLTALLRKHPEVERGHVKLWLRGAGQLERIVQADVLARSEALVDDIVSSLPRYVQTTSFSDAKELLSEHNVVIVTGPPGVGKTTLSRLLLLDSVEAKYVPYAVRSDITEAWRLFKVEEPQVFFFDDFLGRTSLFEGVSDDSRDIAGFIRRVRQIGVSRLILSTREYVLQQAREQVEDLKWQELEADRYSLTLDSYSRFDRAHIFYNHVFFSPQITAVAKADLINRRGYLRIIDHPSYSPRLIEWITGMGGHDLGADEQADYTAYCLSVLDDPSSIWAYAYSQGLDPRERCLLSQLVGLPAQVPLEELELAYRAAAKVQQLPTGQSDFEAAMKVVQDSFVSIRTYKTAQQYVSPLNPSLIDFLKAKLLDDPEQFRAEFLSAYFFVQVVALRNLALDAGIALDQWSSEVARAVGQTLHRNTREEEVAKSIASHSSHPLGSRIKTLCRWCEETPELRADFAPILARTQVEVMESFSKSAILLIELPTLLWRLDKVGFEVADAAKQLKAHVEEQLAEPSSYEALTTLRQIRPAMFTDDEWDDIQDAFRHLAEEYLEDPTEWFESTEDLDHFWDIAVGVGVDLDDTKFADAEVGIGEWAAEQAERALEQLDPEDDYHDRSEDRELSDDRDIESLFGTLDE